MPKPLRLAINGARGRMGRQLVALSRDDPRFGEVVELGADSDFSQLTGVDVLVDFSSPQGLSDALAHCRSQGVVLVSGTTGIGKDGESCLDAAGKEIAVLHAANFSLGVAVLTRLLAEAASMLPDWDLEIVEAHHAAKRDAPSGTALSLGRAAAEARQIDLDAVQKIGRRGESGPRSAGEIGFSSIRAADIVGEHNAILATAGERIELGHRATDRAIFARGALAACAWLAGREPGRYTLDDMLGTKVEGA
ncbi:MAG: 4-hydroxy-tetrahydrodipicolinate reductase [Rhodanobacteraceae bacterium]